MSKPAPLQHGKHYHIYSRGNNRENVFLEERNYPYFLKLYAKYVEPIADTYAYCLLRNHFHFLVRVREQEELSRISGTLEGFQPKSPSQQFGNLFNAYAKAINRAYDRTGSLFQNPFGRVEVTSDAHFVHLVTYIHRNPQQHGFVDDFRAWPHSSYHTHLVDKPTRLKRDDVLAWFGGVEGFDLSHQEEVDVRLLAPLVLEDFE